MAARTIWKGKLRLSLASVPAEIDSTATSGGQISFRHIPRGAA